MTDVDRVAPEKDAENVSGAGGLKPDQQSPGTPGGLLDRDGRSPDESAEPPRSEPMTDRVAPEELVVEAESSHTPADVAGVLLRAAQHIERLEGALRNVVLAFHLVHELPSGTITVPTLADCPHATCNLGSSALSHSAPKTPAS